MNNLTKIFLTSMALTLGACDEPAEFGDDFGDGAIAFRPLGFNLNTSFMGGHDYDELNLVGAFHKSVRLDKVCLSVGNNPCLSPGVAAKGTPQDELWVQDSQLFGKRIDTVYKGKDFNNSRWYVELDHNRDGAIDSTIQLVLISAKGSKTLAATPVPFWNYYWAYDSMTATGLVTKYIKQEESPTPMCEVDPDTGSLGSVLLANTHIDTSATTKGLVEEVPHSMFVACHSGAAGKAPIGWNYVMHDVGRLAYENVIRMIRADYNNDGQSFTAPGEKLTVTDDRMINKQYDAAFKLEGLISLEKGWLCVFAPRMVDIADVVGAYPNITICDEKASLGDSVGGVVSNVMTQPVF